MPCQANPQLRFGGSCSEEEAIQLLGQVQRENKADVETYLDRVGAPDRLRWWPRIFLMTHHLGFYINNPGDCRADSTPGINQGLGLASTASRFTGLAATGASATAGVAGIAGASAVASGALLATGIGAIAGLALLPFSIIGAHHAKAVAEEASLLCDATASYNQWYDAIEAALKSGQVMLSDALTNADNATQTLLNALNAKVNGQNGPYMFTLAVRALQLQNKEKTFPGLVPPPSTLQKVEATLSGGGSSTTSVGGLLSSPSASKWLPYVALGGAALLAKLIFGAL